MTLADQSVRDRIVGGLDVTMVVEAAAGTGKTTELVRRIVAVVASGRTTFDKIVAVTFTEKAAGELKLRVREQIEERRRNSTDNAERVRLDGALEKLEEARISTIHSFCRDLLQERPVEAGVDPLFEVAPQDEADVILRVAFERWFEEALRAPGPGLRRMLARADNNREETPTGWLFNAAIELSQWRDFPAQWTRPAFEREAELESSFAEMRAIGDLADLGSPEDWLYESLAKIRLVAREAARLENIRGCDLDAREAALMKLLRGSQNYWNWKGFGANFGDHPRADVMRRREEFHRRLETLRERIGADLAPQLRHELQPVIDHFQELKRRAGKLDFMDLLLLTRDMLRDHASVRMELQERFTHIFIDEFQDTDPLQAEIMLLLAADDPNEKDFQRARPAAGKLFIVGDPKQSIYRFRRADVALYQRVKAQLVRHGARLERLTVSFRARPELQSLVNSAIAPWMKESETQAAYVALDRARADSPQPPIIALPVPKPYGRYGKITNYAIDASVPKAVGAFVHWLVRESGWKITESNKPAALVAMEPRHICILFRRMTNFRTDVAREYARELEARHGSTRSNARTTSSRSTRRCADRCSPSPTASCSRSRKRSAPCIRSAKLIMHTPNQSQGLRMPSVYCAKCIAGATAVRSPTQSRACSEPRAPTRASPSGRPASRHSQTSRASWIRRAGSKAVEGLHFAVSPNSSNVTLTLESWPRPRWSKKAPRVFA